MTTIINVKQSTLDAMLLIAGKKDIRYYLNGVFLEWDHEKNGDLLPTGVVAGSTKVVGWVCSKGHKWKAQVRSRLTTGCAVCTNKKGVFPCFIHRLSCSIQGAK